jgi:hypothetical protein
MKDREITALIAYLQRLGTDIKVKKPLKINSHAKVYQTPYGHDFRNRNLSNNFALSIFFGFFVAIAFGYLLISKDNN